MEISCQQEHTLCLKHIQKKDSPFQFDFSEKGQVNYYTGVENTILIFLMKGKILLSYDGNLKKKISENEILLIPPYSDFEVEVLENMDFMLLHLDIHSQLCEHLSLNSLLPLLQKNTYEENLPVQLHPHIKDYVNSIKSYAKNQLFCSAMYLVKLQELYCLLSILYEKEVLASLFSPILNKDISFKESVLKNYRQAHTVIELSQMLNYSVTGFNHKFKKCFGISAAKWIETQKAASLLKDLKENRKTIKELVSLYNFSSEARLFEFCKRVYGKRPGEIRKNN